MAKKKTGKRPDIGTLVMNGAMAFGGGIGAEIVGDQLNKMAPDWVAENPKIAEAVPAGVAMAGLYFMPGKMDPLFYGMIGGVGANMAEDIVPMAGFSRTRGLNGDESDQYAKAVEFVEQLQKKGFDPGASAYAA